MMLKTLNSNFLDWEDTLTKIKLRVKTIPAINLFLFAYSYRLFKVTRDTEFHNSKDPPQLLPKRKITSKNLQILNEKTSEKELSEIIKKLKIGKSVGKDRISNEMIKCSYPLLKECFLKLFKVVVTIGDVPDYGAKV